ncbi:DUF3022 domain-containing protein [Trinickia sp. LjRoot230]|uniref:DUF3022 domain-containing protein n=1 Tax=Trinickia sp. LjRoot230 TaxID=3342288 RepID=UPI003ED1609E
MIDALDRKHCVVEIEHALSKSFPHPSTSITHVTGSDGIVTIQVSWVASASGMSVLDSRCALNIVLEPDALEHYAALHGAQRLHAREAVRALAEDQTQKLLPDEKEDGDLMECNPIVDVSASLIDAAARGRA